MALRFMVKNRHHRDDTASRCSWLSPTSHTCVFIRGATAEPGQNHGGITAEPGRNHGGITAESRRNHGGITAESRRNHGGVTADIAIPLSYRCGLMAMPRRSLAAGLRGQ